MSGKAARKLTEKVLLVADRIKDGIYASKTGPHLVERGVDRHLFNRLNECFERNKQLMFVKEEGTKFGDLYVCGDKHQHHQKSVDWFWMQTQLQIQNLPQDYYSPVMRAIPRCTVDMGTQLKNVDVALFLQETKMRQRDFALLGPCFGKLVMTIEVSYKNESRKGLLEALNCATAPGFAAYAVGVDIATNHSHFSGSVLIKKMGVSEVETHTFGVGGIECPSVTVNISEFVGSEWNVAYNIHELCKYVQVAENTKKQQQINRTGDRTERNS